MDGSQHDWRKRRINQLPPMLGDPERLAKQRLRGRRPQTDYGAWLNQRYLSIQPWAARRNLARTRLLVDAPLAPRFPLEVLHDIRDVHARSIYSGFRERPVQEPSGRADKRVTRKIFLVSWLFAHEHEGGVGSA